MLMAADVHPTGFTDEQHPPPMANSKQMTLSDVVNHPLCLGHTDLLDRYCFFSL